MVPRKVKIKNELLTEAVNNVAKENTPENQKEMIKYLAGSGMLLPVKIMPAAKKDANGYYRFSPGRSCAGGQRILSSVQHRSGMPWSLALSYTTAV